MSQTVSQRSHTVPLSSLLICISSELPVAAAHATPQVESPWFIKLLSLMQFADATYLPSRSERLQSESAPCLRDADTPKHIAAHEDKAM
eukprot:3083872-Pleurochrysis_carterae.AAC.1